MPIPTTNTDALIRHLIEAGVNKDMDLVVHARLASFGRLPEKAATVYQALRQVVGEGGTLIFPTYTLHLDAETPYDLATTKPTKVGQLSEFILSVTPHERSMCPLHNHTYLGKKAHLARQSRPAMSMGDGSDFDIMAKAGVRLLLLGCNFTEGATVLHHFEALKGVPYRSWVKLPRKIVSDDGNIQDMVCNYFGRAKKNPKVSDFSKIERIMRTDGHMTSATIYGRESHLISLSIFQDVVSRALANDPFVLVRP